MKSKILKKTNRLGGVSFVALVEFKVFNLIPVWLSVCYFDQSKDIGIMLYRIHYYRLTSFEYAERSIEQYEKWKQGKPASKEVRRKAKIKPEKEMKEPNKSQSNDPVVKMTFPELREFLGYNLRNPTDKEVNMILRDLSVRAFSNTNSETQFEDFSESFSKDMFEEVAACSKVYEFESVGRRIFCFTQVHLLLVDDDKIEQYGQRYGKEPHHHMNVCLNYFMINSKDEVKPLYGYTIQECLEKTQ